MKFALLLFVLLGSAAAGPQQRAPETIGGCRAVWQTTHAEVPLEIGNRTLYLRSLSVTDLTEKSFVMVSCATTDSENGSKYELYSHIFHAEVYQRYVHFVERHRLVNQFLKEDSSGER
jgi:hypothetical protein